MTHGYDFSNFDSNPSDDNGHGTACAGLVAAVQDNSIGVSGVAPGCKVAAVKASNSSGFFYASANVPAYVYCADNGFKVMSMSFFSDEVVPAERDAFAYRWCMARCRSSPRATTTAAALLPGGLPSGAVRKHGASSDLPISPTGEHG
jgi:subtilisin family serine protease